MASVASDKSFCFRQIHIDAARNSTDDFNPFHEPRKCRQIRGNPYAGAIVLGFQLEFLIEHEINLHRDMHGEAEFIARHNLHYSNYQLTFANALLPDERFRLELKPTLVKTAPPALSNRIVIRKEKAMVMIGYKRETAEPLVLVERNLGSLPDLQQAEDRAFLPGTNYFLKRKFMNTGNAKNFVAGSLCDQGYYFDELEDRINFPDMFPASLLSCALLEKAMNEQHDFMTNPMVYVAHNISVDRRLARSLRSNDVLNMLVSGPEIIEGKKGLEQSAMNKLLFNCFGLVQGQQILYRAEVHVAPLHSILNRG
jgi:hypothetical protein